MKKFEGKAGFTSKSEVMRLEKMRSKKVMFTKEIHEMEPFRKPTIPVVFFFEFFIL